MALYETGLDNLRSSLTAREQAELRRAQKGFTDRSRLFTDGEPDPNKLVTKRGLVPSRDKEETSETDFLTEFTSELYASNKSLREQVEEAIQKAESESTQKEPKLNVSGSGFEGFETGVKFKADIEEVFGLNDFQAAAMVGNFDHETGGFTMPEELKPLVPGSRGGAGWAMWTGKRRKKFENFAKENNLDINSYEANFGFFVQEVQNDPYFIKIIEQLEKTKNVDEATEVFSKGYLNPGIPKMNSRKKKSRLYLGK
tara:strand:+ start:2577 stop:3344 length:768 start_codon:yes stop_codon:yes gene_type:complete